MQQRAKSESEFRITLYKQLRKRGENGFNLTSLRAFTKMLLEEYALPAGLQDLYTFNPENNDEVAAYIDEASLPEVQLLLVDAMLGDCFFVSTYDIDDESYSLDTLLAMASAEGIDSHLVRTEIEMRTIQLDKLQAAQFDRFLHVAPERVNELALFVLSGDPLHVAPLELAARKNGFIYGHNEDMPTSKACYYKPVTSPPASAERAHEPDDHDAIETPAEATSTAPAIEPVGALVDAVADVVSDALDGDMVNASDFIEVPAVKPATKTARKSAGSTAKVKPKAAPNNPWPFPKSPVEKTSDNPTGDSA